MSSSEIYDLIIIGGGPGGLTAGIYAMRAALKTALIELGAPGGQMNNSDSVENWPGDEHIGGAELAMKFSQHAQSYGLDVISQEVVELKPGLDVHTVKLANGDSLMAHAVILATGGSPRKLQIPGEEEYYGKGVSDALRASALLQQRAMAECKIEILWNSVVTEIKANDNGVYAVDLKNTQTGEKSIQTTDGVFIFIGFEPNNKLVPAGTKMNADGYVVTDEKCETNAPGIFVIGDLREKYFRQIVISASDGATATLAAAHYVETRKSAEVCELPEALQTEAS